MPTGRRHMRLGFATLSSSRRAPGAKSSFKFGTSQDPGPDLCPVRSPSTTMARCPTLRDSPSVSLLQDVDRLMWERSFHCRHGFEDPTRRARRRPGKMCPSPGLPFGPRLQDHRANCVGK